jgi:hypothetical protein
MLRLPFGNRLIRKEVQMTTIPVRIVADRTALAQIAAQPGDTYFLAESGREGLFAWRTGNRSSDVTKDPAQGVFVAPAATPNGSAGVWARVQDGRALRPEWFGAKGDGSTNDTNALVALSAFVNASGGGLIDMTPGAVYIVGGAVNQPQSSTAVHTAYNWAPTHQYILHFAGCTGVEIRGNGATIRNAGGRYGTFNPATGVKRSPDAIPYPPDPAPSYQSGTTYSVGAAVSTAPNVWYYSIANNNLGNAVTNTNFWRSGLGAATPYYAMINFEGCVGAIVDDLELDGNIGAVTVGAGYGDAGIQIPMTGLRVFETRDIRISGVSSHHHGLDGISVDGATVGEANPREQGRVENSSFEFNGRQGMSFVGGRGWYFLNCKFNHTGMETGTGTTAGPVRSAPCAGVDFEAEGSKKNRDITFQGCEFVNNRGVGAIADSGTPTARVTFIDCKFVGTVAYSIWLLRPQFRLKGCTIVGTAVNLHPGYYADDEFDPHTAVAAEDCIFTDDAGWSPITGTGDKVFSVNNLLIEGGQSHVNFARCKFIQTRNVNGGFGNFDSSPLTDCTFIAKAGVLNAYGRVRGSQSHFVENGGYVSVPGGTLSVTGHNNCGNAEDSWLYTTVANNVPTTRRMRATIDEAGNVLGVQYTAIDGDWPLVPGVEKMQWWLVGPLTAARTFTLSTNGARDGHVFRIVRTAASTGTFPLNVGSLKALSTGQWCEVQYRSGSGWQVTAFGNL